MLEQAADPVNPINNARRNAGIGISSNNSGNMASSSGRHCTTPNCTKCAARRASMDQVAMTKTRTSEFTDLPITGIIFKSAVIYLKTFKNEIYKFIIILKIKDN
jgi:predicted nucleic-acid-binding Zn-ribbon protein